MKEIENQRSEFKYQMSESKVLFTTRVLIKVQNYIKSGFEFKSRKKIISRNFRLKFLLYFIINQSTDHENVEFIINILSKYPVEFKQYNNNDII